MICILHRLHASMSKSLHIAMLHCYDDIRAGVWPANAHVSNCRLRKVSSKFRAQTRMAIHS